MFVFLFADFLQGRIDFKSKLINFRGYQKKITITNNKLYYSNSEILVTGIHSDSITLPLFNEKVVVTKSIFSNVLNYESDGGAISSSIYSNSLYPPFLIEGTTFYECYSFKQDGKGGALYIQGYSFSFKDNCLMSCAATSGVFGFFAIQPKFDCFINQSTFHTNSKPGIGRGSIIVSSEYLYVVDNNFTNINVGSDGSALIATVSFESFISRNIFQDSKGESIVFVEIIPSFYVFQLLNFINNVEKGNGIVLINSDFMISKCCFYGNSQILINTKKGSTFLYQCYFDSPQKSSNSIFKGSVKNKKPIWGDRVTQFAINPHIDTYLCLGHQNGNVESIYTPTRTPYFYGFSPNPADIVILTCFGVLAIFLIFTLVYFLWYCICSKPNLKSSIKYLKIKGAHERVDDLVSFSDYSDSEDINEKRNSKSGRNRKKSKSKKIYIDSFSDSNISNSDNKSPSKKKKSKKRSASIDEDSQQLLSQSDNNEILNSDSDPELNPKSKSKSKDKKKSDRKSKSKSKDKNDITIELIPDSESHPLEIKSDSGSHPLSDTKLNSEIKHDSESLPIGNASDSIVIKSDLEPEPKVDDEINKSKSKHKHKHKHKDHSKNDKKKSKLEKTKHDADKDEKSDEVKHDDRDDEVEKLDDLNNDEEEEEFIDKSILDAELEKPEKQKKHKHHSKSDKKKSKTKHTKDEKSDEIKHDAGTKDEKSDEVKHDDRDDEGEKLDDLNNDEEEEEFIDKSILDAELEKPEKQKKHKHKKKIQARSRR